MNMKLNGLLGLLTIWPAIIAANQAVTLPQADISYKGTTKDGIEHFQNIKYAHDTCGHRRFAPPEPYTPPSGTIVDATRPGPECPQLAHAIPPFLDETTNMSEDCLHLRIARPVGIRPDEKLPVVLYVHGGGLVKGSCSDSHTEPDRLVQYAMSIGKPIIFVAMNYRLSIFGFARLPILKDKKSINVGVRDQRLAFEWVKNNIEAFGGDNTRITAYGLSAGATLTSLHLTSFAGEKGVPFTQAWLMSGPPGTALNMTSDATTLHTLAVADKVNCVKENERKTLDCLMNLPMGELLDAAVDYSTANHPPAGLFTFIPSIDDDVFTERPSVLYRRGDFVKGLSVNKIPRNRC